MPDDAPHFDEQGRLIAPRYGDVYFSADDGLAETRHVFLEGNRLAERFAAMRAGEVFTIGETGFGTGLNFLAAWQLFEQHAPADARLKFVSVEGLPLAAETMRQALSPWPELMKYRDELMQQWGTIRQGRNRFSFAQGRVGLTLGVGEVGQVLASIDTPVDAWFLDGFAPSRNPAMWSDEVFGAVARVAVDGCTLATYTAAGFVRRGLASVGFAIEKRPGFGTKRDMTVGRYAGRQGTAGGRGSRRAATDDESSLRRASCRSNDKSVIVIGGSLAGAFVARALAERGLAVTVLESQQQVNGELPALTPRTAVVQPKIGDINDPTGRWQREGYASALHRLTSDPAIARRAGWQACGAFHAAYDDRAERRLRRFVEQFGGRGLCRWIDAAQTQDELGIALPVGGVVIDHAGVLRPAGLCAALLDHDNITLRDSSPARSIEKTGRGWSVNVATEPPLNAGLVVIANALDAMRFEPANPLKLKPVRGQVTLLRSADQAGGLAPLRRAVFYGGYATPPADGLQSLGASFVPGDSDTAWRDAEHQAVCDQLARVLPDEAQRLRHIAQPTGWVGLRVTTPDHRADARQVAPGLFVSLGHGSHGIASAARAAQHLADVVCGQVGYGASGASSSTPD